MPEVDYSGTPLIKKIGIKAEMSIWVFHAPDNYFELRSKNVSDQFILKMKSPICFTCLQRTSLFLKKWRLF